MCIGATTPAEFRKSIEKDRSLERRFQAVKVPPPSEAEAVSILDGVRERYESFHQVRYTDEALQAAVYQSHRYIPDRFLPDKAIDVIDEAGARVKLRVRREQGAMADQATQRTGAEVGIHPKSEWNNPEPEIVLAVVLSTREPAPDEGEPERRRRSGSITGPTWPLVPRWRRRG